MDLIEEARILTLVRNGNPDAFTEIVKDYHEPIKRYLYRVTGDYDTAQDLTQDTFIQAYQSIMKTTNDLSLKAWLYRIATNNARQLQRRKRILSFVPFHVIEQERRAEDKTDNRDNASEIQGIMLRLSKEQRTYMVLHYVEGFKYREIAEIVGVSEESVCSCIARGKKAFKDIYTEKRR